MDSDRINRWLTLIANFGVLIGIVLLVYEIRLNHEMMRAQIRNEIANSEVERIYFLAGNSEMLDVLVRNSAGQELDAADALRLQFLRFGTIRAWENHFYQYKLGLFDEQEYLAGKESWKSIVNRQKYQSHWCTIRSQVSNEFREEIDAIFESLQCD